MKKNLMTLAITGLLLLAVAAPVNSAGLIPCDGIGPNKCEVKHLLGLMVDIYNFLLGFAGLVALLLIVSSGFMMLIYSYFENAEQILTGAKTTLTRAIFGLVIVAAAYLIVNTLIFILTGKANGITEIVGKLLNP